MFRHLSNKPVHFGLCDDFSCWIVRRTEKNDAGIIINLTKHRIKIETIVGCVVNNFTSTSEGGCEYIIHGESGFSRDVVTTIKNKSLCNHTNYIRGSVPSDKITFIKIR